MYDDYEDSRHSSVSGALPRGAAAEYYENYESGHRPHRTEYYYNDGRSADGRRVHQEWEAVEEPDSHGDHYHHHERALVKTRSRSAHTYGSSRRNSSHHRHRDSSLDGHRRRDSSSRSTERKWEQAAGAALVAGAIEGFRVRNEHGQWAGSKGARVATAAIGAAAIDAGIDRDPEHHTKRHVAEATVGGLLLNRIANGPRDHR